MKTDNNSNKDSLITNTSPGSSPGLTIPENSIAIENSIFRPLFENMLEGFAYCKMIYEGNRPVNFKYIIVNKSFETITHLQNVAGNYVTEVIPGILKTNPELFEIYGRVALTGVTECFETYVDQVKVWFLISVYSPEKEYFVAIFEDITSRKETEQKILNINKELLNVIAAKDKFFSIIAHDLKSPFQAILGLSSLLADPNEKLSAQDAEEYTLTLHTLLKNEYELLHNLLTWAAIQMGKSEFTPVKINLSKRLIKVLALLSVNARKKDITIINEVDNKSEIISDENMLKSILQNIIANAIKFSFRGGNIKISSAAGNNFMAITVEDKGVGMDKETLDKLFKIDSTFTTRGTEGELGTGLGMILCKEMIGYNGGELKIFSDPGIGTKVVITIPLPENTNN
jgi:signal transduction histidine kinase